MNRKLKCLYRFLEGKPDRNKKLERELAQAPELRREKERIELLRTTLKESAADSFSPGFAKRILDQWDQFGKSGVKNGIESLEDFLKILFLRVAMAGTIILILLISYHLIIGAGFSWEETYYASDAAVEELQQLALF